MLIGTRQIQVLYTPLVHNYPKQVAKLVANLRSYRSMLCGFGNESGCEIVNVKAIMKLVSSNWTDYLSLLEYCIGCHASTLVPPVPMGIMYNPSGIKEIAIRPRP